MKDPVEEIGSLPIAGKFFLALNPAGHHHPQWPPAGPIFWRYASVVVDVRPIEPDSSMARM
jgi:hypothetical protein